MKLKIIVNGGEKMIKFIQWFLIGIAMIVLTACGGSSGDKSQAVKATYLIQDNVKQYSATDEIKRVDNTTTFTAPTSIGLSEGNIFIYENVAYKISMIAIDDISDTATIFTKKPTLNETIDKLEIKGTIPFTAPKTSMASNFKLNARVTDKRTNKKSTVTFECEVPNDSEEVSGGFTFGVVCTAKSGDATIKIESTETVKGGVDIDYNKKRNNKQNTIGFNVNLTTISTLSTDYEVEINNDQDPKKLFNVPLNFNGITVNLDFFFLAGVSFDGSASYTRTDNYHYKQIYDFNFKKVETEQSATSINDLKASINIGAHVGLRPMVSVGVFYINIVGLYVDAKVKEAITVSGELSDKTSNTCATSKLDFSLQAGYKLIGGEYKLLGEPYIKNLRTDTTDGCSPSYQYYFLLPRLSCPARPYSTVSKKSNKNIRSTVSTISTNTPDDGISSELSNQESYERIIQIDKTGIGDKTISKVTWEVVDGDMDLKIESIENDGSRVMLSAIDSEGDNATLKATIYATDGTTISQEINIVRNSKPVAVPKVYISGNNLVLDASSSYDPDGNKIIGYGWFFTDTGKKIINKSAINKVPLSNLPNPVNLRMAVVSDNKPMELSKVENISFDMVVDYGVYTQNGTVIAISSSYANLNHSNIPIFQFNLEHDIGNDRDIVQINTNYTSKDEFDSAFQGSSTLTLNASEIYVGMEIAGKGWVGNESVSNGYSVTITKNTDGTYHVVSDGSFISDGRTISGINANNISFY